MDLRYGIISLMILLAAVSRIIPHPANFAPIAGMALFGAVYFNKRFWAFLIPVLSMWISDLLLNNVIYGAYFDHFVWFYQGCYWTYGAFVLIGLMGMVTLKKIKVKNLILASMSASIVFFVVSNFGVWVSTTMYPENFSGLVSCYIAGLPFFKNTLLGDLVYTGVLFGSFEFAKYKIPFLRIEKQTRQLY